MKAIKNNPKYLLNDEAVILLLLSGILYIFNIDFMAYVNII